MLDRFSAFNRVLGTQDFLDGWYAVVPGVYKMEWAKSSHTGFPMAACRCSAEVPGHMDAAVITT